VGVLECVVNVSEGRDPAVLARLAAAAGAALLDVHTDADHHRSVFTLAASDPEVTQGAARALATVAAGHLSLRGHDGIHPRLGVVDVVPFVALAPTSADVAVDAARSFADWMGTELRIPVFLYDLADPSHRTLPSVRHDAFRARAPDAGPAGADPRLGAAAVGARPPLVAVNIELDRDDLELARTVAHEVRERDGGLAGVRALGLRLASRRHSQVSMNLVELEATGLERACVAVRERLEAAGAGVARVELVGLVPRAVLDAVSPAFREWSGISEEQTIEARVARAGAGAAGAAPGAGPDRPA
jgi:glutamate formiminotransferase